MKQALFSLIKTRILCSSLAWIQSRMNINVAHLSQFYLAEISREKKKKKKRLENGFLSNCKCNYLRSLRPLHPWKVTEIRKTFLSGRRQLIQPSSKRGERSVELQSGQPHFSPQENYCISCYRSWSRYMKQQVMGSNQPAPIYQGHILVAHPDCHLRGNGWCYGRREAADVIQIDHSKAFHSMSHSSLVARLRVWTTRRMKKLWTIRFWIKMVSGSSLTVRWLQMILLCSQS